MKKIPQTDAIFENVFRENQASDDNPKSLRLSLDTKAKVKIGNLSRGGKARGLEAKTADDHDTEWQSVLVPFGILNTDNEQLSIYLGQSAETSDFIVDCLTAWWRENQLNYSELDELVIDLDGGSATRSNRTQFIKRMVELSQAIDLRIRLIYYPPYHSKYNPIERCWAALENYWNGTILDSVATAVQCEQYEVERSFPHRAFSRDNLSNRSQSSSRRVKTLSISMATLSYFTPMGYHHCPYLIGILFSCKSLSYI